MFKNTTNPTIFFTINTKNYELRLSKTAFFLLSDPDYISVIVKPDSSTVLIFKSTVSSGVKVVNNNNHRGTRNREVISRISKLLPPGIVSKRYYGYYNDGLLVFNLGDQDEI